MEGSQPTPNQLIREIDNLFEAEYFEAEISDDIGAILQLTQMERDKVKIIKNLMGEHMANGLDKKEARDLAKEEYESTISQKVAEILDISPEQSMFELPEGYDNWQDWEADRKEREECYKRTSQDECELI